MYILIYSYSITARKVCHKGPLRPGFRRRVLRLTGPTGRRVLRFDSTSVAEGCGIALSGDEYICRLRRSYTILRAKRASLCKEAINCGEAATTTLAPSGASNLRTLSGAKPLSILRTFLHNPSTQPFYTTHGEAVPPFHENWQHRNPYQITANKQRSI